jgi:type II secretory pathway component PulF
VTTLTSGILLLVIGGSMVWIGLAYRSMPQLSDWQISFSESLQHAGQTITNATSWIPNWLGLVLFLAILGGLAGMALKQIGVWGGKEEALVTLATPDTDKHTASPTGAIHTREEDRREQ